MAVSQSTPPFESRLLPAPTLSGQYVRLEPMAETHFADLCEQIGEAELWRYMGSGNLGTPERLRDWMERMDAEQAAGRGLTFAQVSLAENKAVGATRLFDYQPYHRTIELGATWLGAEYRRTGINTEAKYLLLGHAFEQMNVNRVTLKTDIRNERSQRAIERLGAVREGVLRSHLILWDGHVRDTVYYSIIASEWPAVKAGLEAKMQAYANAAK